MHRPSSIWYRKEDGWYYTTLNRKQIKLAQDKKEATQAFHELMAAPDVAPAGATRLSFRTLADRFLDHCLRAMEQTTYDTRRCALQRFCDHIGRKAVADLRIEHMSSWEAKNTHWSTPTVTAYRSLILACLNWGEN